MMQHLLLDLYGCNAQQLADADGLRRFLAELPDHLGIQPAGPPDLYYIDAVSSPDDAGHSGLTLARNHVSLHAWPPYQMMNIDIFSRDPFDEAAALAFVRATFAPSDIEVHAVQRATRWPALQETVEKPEMPGDEREPHSVAPAAHRCLWPGRCTRSTGSALMKYYALHQDLLLPP